MGKPRPVVHSIAEEPDLSTAQMCKDCSYKSLPQLPVLRKNYRGASMSPLAISETKES